MGYAAKIDKSVHDHSRAIRGFSLVELLVGVVIVSIIVAGLYELLSAQDRSYSLQDDTSEMQQNLRVGVDCLTRDLEMAGFGRPGWGTINGTDLSSWYNSGNGYKPVNPTTGTGTSVDIIAAAGAADGTVAALNTGVVPVTLTLQQTPEAVAASFNTSSMSDINIGGRENVKITGIAGNVLSIDRVPTYPYAAGTEVYVVRRTTYTTGTSNGVPVLLVNHNRGEGDEPVCQYVTGLSVTVSANAVSFALTGRTRNPDRTTGQYVTSTVMKSVTIRNL